MPAPALTLVERINRPGPKRLLALDGGGIRGLISVEVLAAIEDQLRQRLRAGPDFVLADYFDYIAGTSTGGIIAALLSLGFPVSRIRDFYLQNGREMFRYGWAPWLWIRSIYRGGTLGVTLREILGADTTLGSERLRTLLLLVMRNASTDSPWPISNNPAAKFNAADMDGCNLDLPLWQLVRASAAAPVFFEPEVVRVGSNTFSFVDGGVTSYNNPAFLLFLMATLGPYNLGWRVGEQQLLLVSVGTGEKVSLGAATNLATAGKSTLENLLSASLVEQDILCRIFGRCVEGEPIDTELGDLMDPDAVPFAKSFTYVRYNTKLTRTALDALGLPDIRPKHVAKLDEVRHIADLQRVGRAVAERYVRPSHFAGFDVGTTTAVGA